MVLSCNFPWPRCWGALSYSIRRLSTTQFMATAKLPANPDELRVNAGLLDLNPNQFAVLQSDVDGAGLKLMNFARSLRPMAGNPLLQVDAVTKFEKEAGAPALRN